MNVDPIETMAADCAGKLLSDDVLAPVSIFVEEQGVAASIVEMALGTGNIRGERAGATIILLQPYEVATDTDLPGATSQIGIVARVTVRPVVNDDPDIGTGLSWSRIGRRVKQLLQHFGPWPNLRLVFDGMDPVPLDESSGEVERDYRFKARCCVDELRKPAPPSITGTAAAVALSCITPLTSIRYTTDGSFPGHEASLYTTPFAVTAGTTVRAVAYKTDFQSSDGAAALF